MSELWTNRRCVERLTMHNEYDTKGTLSQDTGGLVSDAAALIFPRSNTHTPPQKGSKLELERSTPILRNRTNMVCELIQPIFEDYWLTPQAIRTLVLELPPASQALTSYSLVDCLRTEPFCSLEDPGLAKRYYPLSISSPGS